MPVAENAKGRGKGGRSRAVLGRTGLAAALSLATAPFVQAAPGGGKVSAGVASISQSGNTTDIEQSSQNLSIGLRQASAGG